jgi:hypothetical protein
VDPSLLGIIHELAPVLAALFFLATPVAIFWIKKNHQLRMKELELEGASRSTEERMHALEEKMRTIETALAALPAPPSRPELYEGPPTPAHSVKVR